MGYQSIFKTDLFAGVTAVVSGGGTGIGRCIAHELASLGAQVVVTGRTPARLENVVAEINEDGGRATWVRCDIRNPEDIESLFSRVVGDFGRVDVLVNNGGGQFAAPAASLSPKGWRAVVDTNLNGTFSMCRGAFDASMSEHGGSIVNMVADMWRGMPMMAHSGAARAGVVNLTQSLALEWAQSGIRVNAVAPGIIASSGLGNYPEPIQEALVELPQELPAARLGTESEVSAAVCFLLSPGARYINGAALRVDGASSLYRHPFTLSVQQPSIRFSGFHRSTELPELLKKVAGDDDGAPK